MWEGPCLPLPYAWEKTIHTNWCRNASRSEAVPKPENKNLCVKRRLMPVFWLDNLFTRLKIEASHETIYLEVANGTRPSLKRAHRGGSELQEVCYILPNANESDTAEVDVFKTAICILNEYFPPKQSKRFERHVFREMKQRESEIFVKIVRNSKLLNANIRT